MANELAELHVVADDVFAIVHITGEIDISNAASIEQQLSEHVGTADVLVVDLSDLRFLDSSGCAVLDRSAARLRDETKQLRLVVRPGAIIERTLELAVMNAAIEIHPDLESARATN